MYSVTVNGTRLVRNIFLPLTTIPTTIVQSNSSQVAFMNISQQTFECKIVYTRHIAYPIIVIIITRRMQCIVGSLYAVYTAAIFGVVQNYAR